MPILASAHNLSKAFAARPLFTGLTFAVESGERIGLIGPNGAGKSTLLRILAGRTSPDEGTLSFQRGARVGYLEQVPAFADHATVFSTVLEGTADPQDWESQSLAHELLSRLSLDAHIDEPVAKLSGGWKKRVALARELARRPDLLLLDEPTNHLDVESILWLEELLEAAPFAALTVTHDRVFLQKASNRILELDPRNAGGLLSVRGGYADYLETKERLIASQERRETILRNTLRRETEWLRQGAKARTTKQQARIQRAGELESEVGELAIRNRERVARIELSSGERNPKKLLEAKGVAKSFGGQAVFSGVDLLMTPGTRIGLIGANGCGKSTLIRVLLGHEAPDEGSVARSESLKAAYFEQNRESLDPSLTVLKTICPSGDYVDYRGSRVHVKSYLDRFLFTYGQMEMAVGKLSGGEQSRLLIARLMLRDANLLVLDEPTNDLDLATLSVLEECLTEFDGAVLLVTHDRYFLDQVSTRILGFAPEGPARGQVVPFASLAQWEAWHADQSAAARKAEADRSARERARAQAEPAAVSGAPAPTEGGLPQKKRKLSYKDQRELDSMEEIIHRAEAELARLVAESSDPEVIRSPSKLAELSRQLERAQAEVDRLYARWSELEQKVSGTFW